jgi:hypothetical protein
MRSASFAPYAEHLGLDSEEVVRRFKTEARTSTAERSGLSFADGGTQHAGRRIIRSAFCWLPGLWRLVCGDGQAVLPR